MLLIHGLTGTPSEVRFVGKGLHAAGFTVYAPRLAGHCSNETALLATGWRDWFHSVEVAAERLRPHVDRLIVGGLSMGAVLALHLAATRPVLVDGLALYGTTLRYDGWSIPNIARLAFLLPCLTRLGIGRKRRFNECHPYGIKDERIRARIVEYMQSGNSAAAGLFGNPWPSLGEFYLLASRVRRELATIVAPALLVHARNDDIASDWNVRQIERGIGGPVHTVWLDDSYHMVTLDRERQRVVDVTAEYFARQSSEVARPAVAVAAR